MSSKIERLDLFRHKPGASRLGILLAEVSQALEHGRLHEAFRLSDCARRIAPEDATCVLIHAKLLILIGRGAEAALRLSGRTEPALVVARGLALCQQGLFDEAALIGEWALSRFAVDALDGVQQLAFTLCCHDGAARPHFWAGIDSKLRLVGEISSGVRPAFSMQGNNLLAEFFPSSQEGFHSFRVSIPALSSGFVSVDLGDTPQRTLSLFWPPEFGVSGWVVNEGESLRGMAGMEWAPALTFDVVIRQNGRERLRHAVIPSNGASSETAFSLPLACCVGDDSPVEVSAQLPDGRYQPLLGSPLPVRAGRQIASAVEAGGLRSARNAGPISTEKTDIVIPIYAGMRETMDCIESVLATTSATDVELVVVDDASPDSELHDAVARLARTGCITLISNAENLGFPGSANKGMELHPQRDILLLNSDTEVFGDWFARLKRAAYAAEDIGTATPLGDCASIVSYTQGPSMTRLASAEIDRIAGTVNRGKLVDLPVGIGFCLFIKRSCLRETELFDEETFAKGYGEENDFCLRASALGWRHVAATDVFVRHRGGLSFGRRKSMLMERNGRILNMLHPGYDELIARFVAVDPLLDARRAIDMQRLIAMAASPVLIVTGNLLGGVKRHTVARRAALQSEARTVLMLQPSENDKVASTVRLSVAGEAMENLVFRIPEDLETLRDLLKGIGLEAVELHHFIGLPSPVLELVVRGLECPSTIYVHDYSWICPRVFLVNGNGAYCGEPAIDDCERCIKTHGSVIDDPLSVQALRDRSSRLFRDAKQIVAPSVDVRTRMSVYFPGVTVKVMAWETPVVPAPKLKSIVSRRVRVALIGAISIPKGYNVLLKCAQDAAARNLDLEFVLIGYSSSDEELVATGRVFVTGPYADDEVGALLAREQCQIAFFPSVVPETWCYALAHALAQGFAIVAFDLGAIAERLRGDSSAELLPLLTPPGEINAALLRAAGKDAAQVNQKEPAMDDVSTSTRTPTADGLETSIQFLPLPAGTYVFTVNEGAPLTASLDQLRLPAVQVGVAPAASEATVEFVSRATTTDRWLSGRRDMILAKISGGSASLALTSLSARELPTLGINIQRLNGDMAAQGAEPEGAFSENPGVFPARIIAHIQRIGDVPFADGWAGSIGERLWIEAFAIGSAGAISPDLIEYCGVTGDNLQTPWLSNKVFCGSRGRATPMMGCAIRFKTPATEQFDCIYTGHFVSGKVIGPFKNGDLCISDQPLDPLWGIEVYAAERIPAVHDIPNGDAQSAVMA